MMLNVQALVEAFRDAGIERGDNLLVHPSLSALGQVDGGADDVIDSLRVVVGDAGTVVFPACSGCPDHSRERPPAFDARFTRCLTGRIPETARNRPNAIRSLHPTHSVVAFGNLASWITSGHELVRTPCGFGSPYDKLADVAGKILLLGVPQAANTSFHHAEELAGVPHALLPDPVNVTMIDMDGRPVEMRGTYLHRWGPKRDFDSFEMAMVDYGICQVRRVGETEARLIDASLMRTFLLRRLLDNPLATLALSAREEWLGVD